MIKEIHTESEIKRVLQFRRKCVAEYGIQGFLSSEKEKYFSNENFIRNRNGFSSKAFYYEVNGAIKGCIMAYLQPQFQAQGFIGFFDCIEDYDIAEKLLDSAMQFLKMIGCKICVGPFDFSIWHTYRFMTEGFDTKPLIAEPRNYDYYPIFFERYGFEIADEWETQMLGQREMKNLIQELESDYKLFEDLDYKIYQMNPENRELLMRNVYQIIIEGYKHFPYYSYISESDFHNLYQHLPDLLDKDCSWFLENPDGKFLGFVLVFQDLGDKLNSMKGKTNLWSQLQFVIKEKSFKTANIAQGGSTPFFIREAAVLGIKKYGKPLRLGAVGLYKSVKSVSEKYESAAITLMRAEAAIKNYGRNFSNKKRKYSLYKYDLCSED